MKNDHQHSRSNHLPGTPDGEEMAGIHHVTKERGVVSGADGSESCPYLHGHDHGNHHSRSDVKPSAAAKYFCPMCEGVESDQPGECPKCGMALERNRTYVTAAKTIYTCPMHPQIEQDYPGSCPICGMTLEPKVASVEEGDGTELRDMTSRLWVGSALALPVFILAMLHAVPTFAHVANVPWSRLVQFALSTPVVLWAGWPFFVRGVRSFRSGHLNMFTLIAVGVGAAWIYSVAALFFPGLFPAAMRVHGSVDLYFEAAAVIVVLVLVGQVLELRARARTSRAIKALLNLSPPTALRITDHGDEEISLGEVKPGDRLRVRLKHQLSHLRFCYYSGAVTERREIAAMLPHAQDAKGATGVDPDGPFTSRTWRPFA